LRLASLAILFWLNAALAFAACAPDSVSLRGPWGQARFSIELADTPQARSRGLMFRETLARSAGMLFVYDRPQRATFWMKNTLIPLDMVFIDHRGMVRYVHERAIPGDLTMIDGGTGILAVLEINGGQARELGISVGTEVRHPAFSEGPPLWPC